MNKKLLKTIRSGDVDKFYSSPVWRKKRKDILIRNNNECQKCKRNGRVGKGETVHHIKHLKEYPELALTDSNLETLCYQCHNEEHPEKLNNNVIKKFTNIERWE